MLAAAPRHVGGGVVLRTGPPSGSTPYRGHPPGRRRFIFGAMLGAPTTPHHQPPCSSSARCSPSCCPAPGGRQESSGGVGGRRAGVRGRPGSAAVWPWSLVTVLAAGASSGPRCPGRGAERWSTGDGGDGPGTRVTVSPLVDIRKRLVDQSDVEVFTVRSQRAGVLAAHRARQLRRRVWSSSGSFARGRRRARRPIDPRARRRRPSRRTSPSSGARRDLAAGRLQPGVGRGTAPTSAATTSRPPSSSTATGRPPTASSYSVESRIPRLDRAS